MRRALLVLCITSVLVLGLFVSVFAVANDFDLHDIWLAEGNEGHVSVSSSFTDTLDVYVNFYVNPGLTDTHVYSQVVSIPPGNSDIVFAVPQTVTVVGIEAVLDPGQLIGESNESNNSKYFAVPEATEVPTPIPSVTAGNINVNVDGSDGNESVIATVSGGVVTLHFYQFSEGNQIFEARNCNGVCEFAIDQNSGVFAIDFWVDPDNEAGLKTLLKYSVYNGKIGNEPVPTIQPTNQPTISPTDQPTAQPTQQSTPEPTTQPTQQPTEVPTLPPTTVPTAQPTIEPVGLKIEANKASITGPEGLKVHFYEWVDGKSNFVFCQLGNSCEILVVSNATMLEIWLDADNEMGQKRYYRFLILNGKIMGNFVFLPVVIN